MVKKMSMEEKRTKMLEVFEKYQSFFKIQELEKIGSKQKGIVENTVKDVVLSLFYDDLISGDKVGTSTYYWSNSNKELHKSVQECKQLQSENKRIEDLLDKRLSEYETEKEKKPITKERSEKLKILNDLESQHEELKKKLIDYAEISSGDYQKLIDETNSLKDEINTCTDNIFAIQDYVCKKFFMDKKDFNRNFNISDDMDYV